ncbi:MAG: ArnT family glycosyltransferase [Phototrophicaceae bacterium]
MNHLKRLAPQHILYVTILLLAIALRVYRLDTVPVGIDGDGSAFGIDALDFVDYGIFPHFVRELYGPEPLTVYLLSGSIVLGQGVQDIYTSRSVTVFSSLAFVMMLYPMVWWLTEGNAKRFRVTAALLAMFGAALSLHVIHISRKGIQSPQIPMVFAALIWFTAWARARNRWWQWALAGVALALTQYVYISARVLPLVVIFWFAHDAWADGQGFKRRFWGWFGMGALAFVLVLPNLILYATTPEAFNFRLFPATAYDGGLFWNYLSESDNTALSLVLKKLWLIVQALGWYFYGWYASDVNQPILTPPLFIGWVFSAWLALRQPRSIAYAWLWLAFPIAILPGIIASLSTAPHAMRLMDMIPLVFALGGMGLAQLWDNLRQRPRLARWKTALVLVGVIGLIVPEGIWLHQYFHVLSAERYANPLTGTQWEQAELDLARTLNDQPNGAYLLPAREYDRYAVSWILAEQFRYRGSLYDPQGNRLHTPPTELEVVVPAQPERIRHDGTDPRWFTEHWVLLQDNQVWLLPALTTEQEAYLLDKMQNPSASPIIDRSETTIAYRYPSQLPADFFPTQVEIPHMVDVTFNEEITLMGYATRSHELTPASTVLLTLYWTTQQRPSADYEIFVQLWDDQQRAVAKWHDVAWNDAYRTRLWQSDELTPTHHVLNIPPDLAVGRYTLVVGLYRVLENEPLPTIGTTPHDGFSMRLPDFRYSVNVPNQWEARSNIGNALRFSEPTGEVLALADVHHALTADALDLTLDWEALARPSHDYSIFLHLVDGDGQILAQADQLIRADFPTNAWRTDDHLSDQVRLMLPPSLPDGDYTVWMGVYDWRDGARLLTPLASDGRVALYTLNVADDLTLSRIE